MDSAIYGAVVSAYLAQEKKIKGNNGPVGRELFWHFIGTIVGKNLQVEIDK